MIAENIKWDVDIKDGLEAIEAMTVEQVSDLLGIPESTYANMSTAERDDYAYKVFKSSNSILIECMGLPEKVEIPAEIAEDPEYRAPEMLAALVEHISDWLSDEYGFCHGGFELKEMYYSVKVSYSWGDEEEEFYGKLPAKEQAFAKACEMAGKEAYVQNEEFAPGKTCSIFVDAANLAVDLTCDHDGEKCFYRIVDAFGRDCETI